MLLEPVNKKMSATLLSLFPSLLVGVSGYLLFHVVSFYYKVSRLPKGPTPLPFIGNVLSFASSTAVHEIFDDWSAKYSPLYTIYVATKPIIVISDSKLGIEAMRKVAFAGRPDFGLAPIIFDDNSIDVFLCNYSKEWEVLKKVAHEAIKKYTSSQRHPFLVSHVVDQIFDRKDAAGKRVDFDALDDFTLMLNAILSSAAFGKDYELDDREFLSCKRSIELLGLGQAKLMILLLVPVFRYVFTDTWKQYTEENDTQHEFVKRRYCENIISFDGSNISTFCHAIIAAQREAEIEDKETSKFMTTNNLMNVVSDLFFAGTDTTKNTLAWIFLFICKNRDMQETISNEIIDVVGALDSIPLPEHKDRCHFTMAFVAEAMRFRTIIPNGVPHKTTSDTVLAGYQIPKGTIVLHPTFKALHDPECWTDPHSFNPNRFLVEGKFSKQAYPYFIPFGVGRRSCPGNQLALLTMFLVVARMMQRAHALGAIYSIKNGNDSVGIHGQKIAAGWNTDQYRMIVEERETQ